MSVLKTCKADNECTMGTPGGCCTYLKLVTMGTLSDKDKISFDTFSEFTGVKKAGDSTHFCLDGAGK
jgi:hypothetical protein